MPPSTRPGLLIAIGDGFEPVKGTPVRWELIEVPDGTHVRLIHSGFDGAEWDDSYGALSNG